MTQNSIAILGSKKSNLRPIIRVLNIKKNQFVVLNDLIMINIKKSISYLGTYASQTTNSGHQIPHIGYHYLDTIKSFT